MPLHFELMFSLCGLMILVMLIPFWYVVWMTLKIGPHNFTDDERQQYIRDEVEKLRPYIDEYVYNWNGLNRQQDQEFEERVLPLVAEIPFHDVFRLTDYIVNFRDLRCMVILDCDNDIIKFREV